MIISAQYAKALHAALQEYPRKRVTYLRGLREALKRRGHEKLLPRIFSEYKKLELRTIRSEQYARVTPEQERSRTLLELYRILTRHG